MDKTKESPVPEKKTTEPRVETKQSPDPTFVRGTISPPIKKG